ncbi:MAG: type II toxin-antitoxin system Phd/YefM family antitoxin [Micromonosporaceae bacterium]|nr:type II toxin-antitoxin system Phd/YefM family antitoxin [Micromonosporaceae bacterium]
MTTTIMPLGEAKTHLSDLVSRVNQHHERITVTVHGQPSAVIIAPEDLEALEETLAILSNPDTLRRLADSDAELARGEVVTADELAAAMAARRRDNAA